MWRFALLAGVAGAMGVGLWGITSRRRGGRALAGYMPYETFDAFRERLDESRERPAFFQKSAERVNEAALDVISRGDGWGRKAFIADVAKQLGVSTTKIAGLLLVANNRGWLTLERADLTGAMDERKVAASEIEGPEGLARYHFVVVAR